MVRWSVTQCCLKRPSEVGTTDELSTSISVRTSRTGRLLPLTWDQNVSHRTVVTLHWCLLWLCRCISDRVNNGELPVLHICPSNRTKMNEHIQKLLKRQYFQKSCDHQLGRFYDPCSAQRSGYHILASFLGSSHAIHLHKFQDAK